MSNQPGPLPSGYIWEEASITEMSPNSYFSVSAVQRFSNGGNSNVIVFHLSDTGWVKLPSVFLGTRNNHKLHVINGEYYLTGRWKKVNTKTAPAGKFYTAIKLVSGLWDTLPGSTEDSSQLETRFASSSHGLYRALIRDSIDVNKQHYAIGLIQQYDTSLQKFNPLTSVIGGLYGFSFISGKNRTLIGGISKINNQSTYGFGYIIGNTIKRNTVSSAFTPYQGYMLDAYNDHIYQLDMSNKPLIKEFDSTFVQSIQTSYIVSGSYGDLGVYNGKVLYTTFESGKNNRNINILCKGQTVWSTIVQEGWGGWANRLSSASGFYVLDHSGFIRELGEGRRIEGKLFIDLDSNCVFTDSIDKKIINRFVEARSDTYIAGATSDTFGNYIIYVDSDTFGLKAPSLPSNCAYDSVIIDTMSIVHNLPRKKPGYFDLKAQFFNGFNARWNSISTITIETDNIGDAADSADIDVYFDSRLTLLNMPAGFTVQSGNHVKAKIKNLGYFDRRRYSFDLWIDSGQTKPDTLICHSLSAYLYNNDADSSNNIDGLCQRVTYSYDPNHISCDYKRILPRTPKLLEYFIEFQNEGNDDAYDVTLKNTLPPALLPETFTALGASHAYKLSLNERNLVIEFPNIMLKPKLNDEEKSKGFFKYSIMTRGDLKNNTQIDNFVDIYFDLNKPVRTNTSVVLVSDLTTDINEPNKVAASMNIYPNPGNSNVKVMNVTDGELIVYNTLGEIVSKLSIVNGQCEINVSEWANGVYYFRCGEMTSVFVKTQ
ncbi:MAG TPA: T9SS type A sorting domain-containing protein [Bacteroidia bacterium]